jgi:two-component system, chemotaxis family, protein-glutamate methylesterase/glutaminase
VRATPAPSCAPGRLVVIGGSWGGAEAVGELLEAAGPRLRCPVVVVLHRGPECSALDRHLSRRVTRAVVEVEDKDPVVAGRVYLAPPGYHLLVEGDRFALSTEGPIRYSRPSIDVAFETAADAYGERVVGVVLTGANDDGWRGAERIARRGGYLVVQDPGTAVQPTMPQAVLDHLQADAVLPVAGIADLLVELCHMSEVPR